MVIREETSEAGMDSLLLFKVSLYLRSKDGQSIVVSLLTDKSQVLRQAFSLLNGRLTAVLTFAVITLVRSG